MPVKAGAVALALAISLASSLALADAVVVTRAMTASTIMEAFVEPEAVRVELEIGGNDQAALQSLIGAASSASTLPVPIPAGGGISVRADGRHLKGSIVELVRRKRIERDEVSGEPLPRPGTEDVVFVALRYPLRRKPKQLVLQPPLNADGYPTTDIGFVIYHQGIAVNDFRYLAAGEPLLLDWEDPFYSRFERRTLNRKYGSPMNVFLYVEPFEVRKELVVRPLDLARFTNVDIRAHEPIPPEQRGEVLQALAGFLEDRAPVTIDGERAEPILDRIHFLRRGLRMTRVVTADEPVDGTNAIIGAIFVYPIDGMPNEVRLTWDLFDERITRVPAAATDEAGPMPSFLMPDDPELQWVNYLKAGTLPGELEVERPRSYLRIPIVFAGGLVLALVILILALRQRAWVFGVAAVAVVAVGWLAPPLGVVRVPVPIGMRAPSGDEARPTLHALLYNVYRALDFREEEVVFDRLAQSLSGDVLERVYLEMRKGLRLENQGGARVRVREVDVLEVVPEERTEADTLRYRTRWNATGSVGHWGHTHMRTNSYDALVTLGRLDGRWKIADIEILEEQRLQAGAR